MREVPIGRCCIPSLPGKKAGRQGRPGNGRSQTTSRQRRSGKRERKTPGPGLREASDPEGPEKWASIPQVGEELTPTIQSGGPRLLMSSLTSEVRFSSRFTNSGRVQPIKDHARFTIGSKTEGLGAGKGNDLDSEPPASFDSPGITIPGPDPW